MVWQLVQPHGVHPVRAQTHARPGPRGCARHGTAAVQPWTATGPGALAGKIARQHRRRPLRPRSARQRPGSATTGVRRHSRRGASVTVNRRQKGPVVPSFNLRLVILQMRHSRSRSLFKKSSCAEFTRYGGAVRTMQSARTGKGAWRHPAALRAGALQRPRLHRAAGRPRREPGSRLPARTLPRLPRPAPSAGEDSTGGGRGLEESRFSTPDRCACGVQGCWSCWHVRRMGRLSLCDNRRCVCARVCVCIHVSTITDRLPYTVLKAPWPASGVRKGAWRPGCGVRPTCVASRAWRPPECVASGQRAWRPGPRTPRCFPDATHLAGRHTPCWTPRCFQDATPWTPHTVADATHFSGRHTLCWTPHTLDATHFAGRHARWQTPRPGRHAPWRTPRCHAPDATHVGGRHAPKTAWLRRCHPKPRI